MLRLLTLNELLCWMKSPHNLMHNHILVAITVSNSRGSFIFKTPMYTDDLKIREDSEPNDIACSQDTRQIPLLG